MGNQLSEAFGRPTEFTPKSYGPITFDPHEGFEYKRKQREKLYTDAEAEAIRLHPSKRDYCGHLAIKYLICRHEEHPWLWNCAHEKHDYVHCQEEDQKLRMKEWERERRLRIRQKRLQEGAEAE